MPLLRRQWATRQSKPSHPGALDWPKLPCTTNPTPAYIATCTELHKWIPEVPAAVKHAGKKPGPHGAMYEAHEPAELGDLAFAGFGEFARQWLLLARSGPSTSRGRGKHQLWVTTGGWAGFNGTYAVDIDEGVMLRGLQR